MKIVKTYNITWYERTGDGDEEYIDSTQLDENNEEFIWQMFEEFGHKRTDLTEYEVDEAEEQLEDDVYESIYGNINIE